MLGRSQAPGVLFETLDAEEFRTDWLFEWLWSKLRRRVGAGHCRLRSEGIWLTTREDEKLWRERKGPPASSTKRNRVYRNAPVGGAMSRTEAGPEAELLDQLRRWGAPADLARHLALARPSQAGVRHKKKRTRCVQS